MNFFFTETLQVHNRAEEGNLVFGARKWLITSLRTSKGDCPSTRKQRAHGSPLHLSLDHLSLAGHVLVVSPYTSSRIRRARYVSPHHTTPMCVPVVCFYSPQTRTVRDAETADRDVGRESAAAISRTGFRKEFKEQIDRNLRHTLSLLDRTHPLSIELLKGSFLNCSDRIGKTPF